MSSGTDSLHCPKKKPLIGRQNVPSGQPRRWPRMAAETVKFLGVEFARQSELDFLLGEKPDSVFKTKVRIVRSILRWKANALLRKLRVA